MADRIRGRRLQAMRKQHFQQNPLCVECQKHGRVTAAEQLDHIIPLNGKGEKGTDTPDNRQGLCKECHRAKTLREFGLKDRAKTSIGLDGWPTGGGEEKISARPGNRAPGEFAAPQPETPGNAR